MVELGVIGGSGLYELAADAERVLLDTPYGKPASAVSIGVLGGKEVAFMTRHGTDHAVPPHLVNYRANIWALKELGVTTLVTSSVVGSLRADYRPGHFVLVDQFYDRTTGRASTFFEGPKVVHASLADPYCPALRAAARTALEGLGEAFHPTGTAVVIQGPRFSTRAESQVYQTLGFSVLSMTQFPETALAREAAMCVVNISFVSDLDAGVAGLQDEPVTAGLVWRTVRDAQPRIRRVLERTVELLEPNPGCACHGVLADI
ncbi:MAG: MTAP family purine nucleoside phosphorylase [Bifidobacteriaceae bacterium]|jgi:5'-methylthioadenosine phosphorylase|nr:MTAP family purine nucleoside phosphorylase [Bifidobacteriaceae bacterium]